MKLTILLLALTGLSAAAQPLTQVWVQPYNGPGNGDDSAVAIAADTNGNVVVTGWTTTTNGYPDWDFVTIKYSKSGLPLWTNFYAGPAQGADAPTALALDPSGRVLVTGFSDGGGTASGQDFVTLAYSSDGTPLWTNRYTGPGNNEDKPQALATDANGNVYVLGYSWTNGSYAYATLKYANNGVPLWTNLFPGFSSSGYARSAMAVAPDGNVFVAVAAPGSNGYGDYALIRYSELGVPLWTNWYNGPGNYDDAPAAVALGTGRVFVTGSSYGSGSGYDFATLAYSTDGTPLWTNRYNGLGNDWDYAKALVVAQNGDVIVAGNSPRVSGGGPEYALLAYSAAGLPLWTNFYTGADNDDEVAALTLDSSGNILVTGTSVGLGTSSDYATVRYSSAGVPLSTNRYNGPANSADYAVAIAANPNGDVFVTGYSQGASSGADFATLRYSTLGPIPLALQKLGGQVVLSWTNAAFGLQSAPALGGLFTNIEAATSPYTNAMGGGEQFFRLKLN